MKEIAPLAVSIAEAVHMTGMGRTSLYLAIQRGNLSVKKSGRRTLVMVDSLRQFLADLPTSDSKHAA